MSRPHVVFIAAIGEPAALDHAEFSLATWRWWCERNGAILHVLRRPFTSVAAMKPHWQRHLAPRILEEVGIEAEAIAVVDLDTMVRWDCPDFFPLAGGELSAVADGGSREWIEDSLRGYRPFFPDLEVGYEEYFNSGFLVLSRKHRSLAYDVWKFYLDHAARIVAGEDRGGLTGYDQTPLNYLVKRLGWPVNRLPPEFNLSQLGGRGLLDGGRFIDRGLVWHFNGLSPAARRAAMESCWKSVGDHYR